MLTLLLTIIFIWLVFKAVENVAEELGRYIRGSLNGCGKCTKNILIKELAYNGKQSSKINQ